MEVYTIGFTQSSASHFFGRLKETGVERLLDVRLNNSSQLAGFAKRDDLDYFLRVLCNVVYQHEITFAPTQAMLDRYKKSGGSWDEYESMFYALMAERKIENKIKKSYFDVPTVLLCSELTAEHCHRRLVLEYLKNEWGDLEIIHL